LRAQVDALGRPLDRRIAHEEAAAGIPGLGLVPDDAVGAVRASTPLL